MNHVGILLGVEARRPASWLLFLAAIGGVSVAGSGRMVGATDVAVGFLLGGILAVAALGAGAAAPSGHLGGIRATIAALFARLVWPVVGGAIGALTSPGGASGPAFVGLLGGVGFSAALCKLLERTSADRADRASGALLITAGVGLAGAAGWSRFPESLAARGGATVVAVAAAIGAAVIVAQMPVAPRKPRGSGRLIASGEPARGRLDLVGMAAAMIGMVVCLFLAPQAAAANSIVAIACFVALAVPEATISPVALGGGWGRLMGAVPLRTASGGARLGMTDLVTESVGFHALLLGWPSLVALALLAGDRERSAGAIRTIAALAVTAAVTWGVASLVRRRADGSTTMAAVIAALVVVWMVAVSYLPA